MDWDPNPSSWENTGKKTGFFGIPDELGRTKNPPGENQALLNPDKQKLLIDSKVGESGIFPSGVSHTELFPP